MPFRKEFLLEKKFVSSTYPSKGLLGPMDEIGVTNYSLKIFLKSNTFTKM